MAPDGRDPFRAAPPRQGLRYTFGRILTRHTYGVRTLMAVKKRSLGRGLDALLSSANRTQAAETADTGQFREIGVELLKRGRYQPRLDIRQESLQDLADSIRAQGVVQPIVIRPVRDAGDGVRYEIIAGERRWRAAQLAGLQKIPVIEPFVSNVGFVTNPQGRASMLRNLTVEAYRAGRDAAAGADPAG